MYGGRRPRTPNLVPAIAASGRDTASVLDLVADERGLTERGPTLAASKDETAIRADFPAGMHDYAPPSRPLPLRAAMRWPTLVPETERSPRLSALATTAIADGPAPRTAGPSDVTLVTAGGWHCRPSCWLAPFCRRPASASCRFPPGHDSLLVWLRDQREAGLLGGALQAALWTSGIHVGGQSSSNGCSDLHVGCRMHADAGTTTNTG